MIASQEKEILRELDLISHEQANTLDRLFPPIDIIAQEQIVSVSWISTIFEEFNEVCELAVNVAWINGSITTDLYGSLKLQQHWLG